MTNDIFSDAREWVLAAMVTLGLLDKLNSEISTRITVGPTRDPAHGDITTNAAMVLGTYHNKDKRVAAAELAGQLSTRDEIASAEAAGPGFINIRLNSEILRAVLPTVLANGAGYGDSRVGARVTVNIEYVSANPTGPVHVGHCRGAVVGDALANLLTKAGFAVTKEYYVNVRHAPGRSGWRTRIRC